MKNFICKKCGNTTYIMREKLTSTGKAIGLYCAKCGTWHKWLNKQEKVLYSTHSAEIDKDKEIARLTAENENLTVELEVAQRDVENLTRTLEEASEEIKALEVENSELRARLERAIELPCVQCVIMLEWIGVEKRAWHCFKQWVVLYKDSCDQIVVEPCTSKDDAEAQLAELKGGRNEYI